MVQSFAQEPGKLRGLELSATDCADEGHMMHIKCTTDLAYITLYTMATLPSVTWLRCSLSHAFLLLLRMGAKKVTVVWKGVFFQLPVQASESYGLFFSRRDCSDVL